MDVKRVIHAHSNYFSGERDSKAYDRINCSLEGEDSDCCKFNLIIGGSISRDQFPYAYF